MNFSEVEVEVSCSNLYLCARCLSCMRDEGLDMARGRAQGVKFSLVEGALGWRTAQGFFFSHCVMTRAIYFG